MDIYIGGVHDRNAALNGDLVAALLNPQCHWKINNNQLNKYLNEHLDVKAVIYKPVKSDVAATNITNLRSTGIFTRYSKGKVLPKKAETQTNQKQKKNKKVEKPETVEKCDNSVSKPNEGGDKSSSLKTEKTSIKKKPESERQPSKASQSVAVAPDELFAVAGYAYSDSDNESFVSVEDDMDDEENLSGVKPLSPESAESEYPTLSDEEMIKRLTMQLTPDIWRQLIHRTGVVVCIKERRHSRIGAGRLSLTKDNNHHWALFSPYDNRIPRMRITSDQWPKDFIKNAAKARNIYTASIADWSRDHLTFGRLLDLVGVEGDLEAETNAALIAQGFSIDEFPDSVCQDLPKIPWTIPESLYAKRRDFRDLCLFTIDPSTARDLDDAVSCVRLPNGGFRVGVHIADVSHFVKPQTKLDEMARERAVTVYLPHKAVPMLPRLLSENLCSLQPQTDRLSFSVEWEMDEEGNVMSEWFGHGVIRSCVQLSYEDAQRLLDAANDAEVSGNSLNIVDAEFPSVGAPHSLQEIAKAVVDLNTLAGHIRGRRAKEGYLKLNQPKMRFIMEETRPVDLVIENVIETNRLIEEFMLLANVSVATKIAKAFPAEALLRRHPPPDDCLLTEALDIFKHFGITLDATDVVSLNNSLQAFIKSQQDREDGPDRVAFVINMLSRPMRYAEYYCGTDELTYHYALNMQLYTHFTSPIRRYADVIVHRLLSAAIDPKNYDSPKIPLHGLASHCNRQRTAAKTVNEESLLLSLALYLGQHGEMTERGIVVGILDRAVDILLTRLGIVKRAYMDKLPVRCMQLNLRNLSIMWEAKEGQPRLEQNLTYFTNVSVILRTDEKDKVKCSVFLIKPKGDAVDNE